MDPVPLQQHPRFADALCAMGRTAEVLDLGCAGRAVLVRRRYPILGEVAYVPRGPIWATSDRCARAEAVERLCRAGVWLIEADAPCPVLHDAGFRQVMTPAHAAELDLRVPTEERVRRLAPKWRGHLRQAQRARMSLNWTTFDGDPRHWLLIREARQRRDRRYHALPQAFASSYARVATDAALILTASDADGPVAGMLFLLHAPVVTYQIGWTGERGRQSSAHHLLLMEAARRFAGMGLQRLDLGTLDTEGNPGLARFKIGAGAQVRALGGSWLRLPVPRRLASLRRRG
ncbi:GNAT family N-acetyltransferase [Rubellimicrobium arenae]|uniref:GNAT family N-acetyltransferase n=1 Tax=Rubellimicrobium arenae TaxID=2817372 RepID=UPI001B310EF6|nr:GNAT family N-acetyltransferase [Rubellimicrobium arenae]